MDALLFELTWFLPWCWFINMCFSVLGYGVRASAVLARSDAPFDGGCVFLDKRRLLGDSTTWAGFLLATLLGIVGELVAPGRSLFMFAILVFFGHALGSFIKRRLNVERGAYLPFVDHVDYVILIGVVSLFSGFPSLTAILIAYGITLLLTPIITYTAFTLGIRTQKL